MAAFQGHRVRREYHKLMWSSVGVLEKAILRWRLKRKGLRKIKSEIEQAMRLDNEQENVGEEEFFRVVQEQAEERVKNSVVKVQSMFRSYKAEE